MKVARYQYKPDGMRCSPVFDTHKGKEWCNAGFGTHGHIGAKEGMPYCSACGQEIGNEKVIE
ncbi:MAG: hypothetical protein CMA09_03970 [Euryarchaeota archaeon]|nr:hypothetical protein [Euryarchaeota archaeon]|tara:strand:+ start:3382 stop:3567 length:186 start_codon:yes stop_codon:yes gene_type:complete